LVEQCVPGSVEGFRSLLGAGRQSLLRTSAGNFAAFKLRFQCFWEIKFVLLRKS